jgi:hypothetical protein
MSDLESIILALTRITLQFDTPRSLDHQAANRNSFSFFADAEVQNGACSREMSCPALDLEAERAMIPAPNLQAFWSRNVHQV